MAFRLRFLFYRWGWFHFCIYKFSFGEVKDHAAITDVTVNLGKLGRDLIRTLTDSNRTLKRE